MRCEQASQSRAVKTLRVEGVSQMRYSNRSLSTEYIEFIYRDGVQILLNTDKGRDGGEVKPELCPQSVTIHPYSFLFSDLLFFSCNYSSLSHHRPADYTCLHNRFLPSTSLDFSNSFLLIHMYFFAIPSLSTMFLLLCHCSRTFRVSGI